MEEVLIIRRTKRTHPQCQTTNGGGEGEKEEGEEWKKSAGTRLLSAFFVDSDHRPLTN